MAIKKLKNQLNSYLRRVNEKIPIQKAFLVGSWAKGKASADSDVDLLIFSDKFTKMDFDERLRLLYRQSVGIDFDLHIHPVTEAELSKASSLTSLGAMRDDLMVRLV